MSEPMEKTDAIPMPDEEQKKPVRVYSLQQKLLLLPTLAIGIGYAVLWETSSIVWYSMMMLVALGAFVVLQWDKVREDAYTWHMFAVLTVTAVMIPVHEKTDLFDLFSFGILMLPILMMTYAVFVVRGIPVKQEGMAVLGVLKGLFVHPFVNVPHFFLAAFSMLRRKKMERSQRRAVMLGIIAVIPLSVMVLCLLSSADARFSRYILSLFRWPEHTWFRITETVFFIFNTIVCGMLFYSFLYGTRYKEGPGTPLKDRVLPAVTIGIVEGSLVVIYALFMALQFSYLFGGTLPREYTYSEYAVRGFKELMLISVINYGVLAVSVRYGGESMARKVMEWALLLATALLLGSAALRLMMYIHAYGWTELRLMSAWLEVYLVALAILTGVRLAKKEFALTRTAILVFYLWFGLLMLGAGPFLQLVH